MSGQIYLKFCRRALFGQQKIIIYIYTAKYSIIISLSLHDQNPNEEGYGIPGETKRRQKTINTNSNREIKEP